jgi:hypothetical protein
MPTQLNRKLSRETAGFLSVDRGSRGRPIIIEIEPPDLIAFRWKGTRRRYTANAARLMQWTIQATIDAERRERRAKRKREKSWPRD